MTFGFGGVGCLACDARQAERIRIDDDVLARLKDIHRVLRSYRIQVEPIWETTLFEGSAVHGRRDHPLAARRVLDLAANLAHDFGDRLRTRQVDLGAYLRRVEARQQV